MEDMARKALMVRWLSTVALVAWIAAAGCKKQTAKTPATAPAPAAPAAGPTTSSARDAAANPAVLLDRSLPASLIEVFGVKLGDPKPAGLTSQPDPSGWIAYRGRDDVFRIENDRVAAIAINDPAVLAELQIATEQDLTAKFGPAEQVIEASPDAVEAVYVYRTRGLTIVWNRRAKLVSAINIGA